MKSGILAGLAVYASGASAEQAENPLSKVIDLLSTLSANIVKDGEAEVKAYKEFFEWCDDTSKNGEFAIKTASSQKSKLEAQIDQLTAHVESSSSEIDTLAQKVASAEKEAKEAKSIRDREHADFVSNQKELMAVVDTVGRAISVLEKEMAKGPAALAQIDNPTSESAIQALSAILDAAAFTTADQKRLTALLQAQDSDAAPGAPAAAVYKSQSGGIVDILEDMKDKAESQLAALRKEETNAKHNHEMLAQSSQDQIDQDNKDMAAQKARRSEAEENKATSQADLNVAVKDLEESKEGLAKAHRSCMTTANDHEATLHARDEELKVIAEAKKVLQDTSGGAVSQTYSFIQVALKAASTGRSADVVRQLAKKYHSHALTQLASRMTSVMRMSASIGDDPFQKVKGLISDMISKLQKEMASEATEKAYCDEQMSKTEAKKEELEADVGKLSTKIDQKAARASELKGQVSELQKQLSAMSKEQAEIDQIRQESSADYKVAKSDLEQGLSGVRKALSVLRKYYGSSEAAAMLQDGVSVTALMQQPAAIEQHSKSTGAASSIIGILEVVESDFANNLAKEETQEADSQEEYEKTTQENKVLRTEKEQGVKYKTQEGTSLSKTVSELSSDRDTSNSELSAVLEYYGKIKERCIAKPETYEQRKARRDAEISGLKEALVVLDEETATSFVQRKHRGNMRGAVLARD